MSETIVVIAIVLGGFGIWLALHREGRVRYRKKALLTGCELEFFHRLRQALPECVVAPQVGLAALIEPTGIGPGRQTALALLATRRAGYAVFDEQMQLLAIIELDHSSGRKRADAAMDRYLAEAGLRTVRFSSKRLPSDVRIRGSVFARGQLQASGDSGPLTGDAPAIEFERPKGPWRNTLNAHS
jgi:hypothetical protein